MLSIMGGLDDIRLLVEASMDAHLTLFDASRAALADGADPEALAELLAHSARYQGRALTPLFEVAEFLSDDAALALLSGLDELSVQSAATSQTLDAAANGLRSLIDDQLDLIATVKRLHDAARGER